MKTQNSQHSGKTSNYNDICTETHGLPNPAWVSSAHITNTKMGPEKWQRWNTSSPKPLGLAACPDETREISPPTSLLDDSQRGSQERGSKVLSLETRAEQNPRSGKARFPGPTPPSLPSAVLLRSSPSEPPSFRRSDRSLSCPRHPPGRPRAPQLTVEGHRSPCHACQRSANIRLLCLTGNRPLPVPSLPSHFRHTSNPLPTCHRVPKRPARELRPFRTCLRTCPPGRRNSVTVRLVPPGGSV